MSNKKPAAKRVAIEQLSSSDFEMYEPRVLNLDFETAPSKALVWGHWGQNVIAYAKDPGARGYLLCAGYKWLDEPEAKVIALPDYKGYTKGPSKEKQLAKAVWKLMDEADIIVGHNTIQFDIKVAMSKFIKYDLGRPSYFRVIDTKTEYKKIARSTSNKLDHLGEEYDLGRKLAHQGIGLWEGCMEGDTQSWKDMTDYCVHDVYLDEKLYLKIRPYMETHPSLAILKGIKFGCTHCGSTRLHKRGKRRWTNLSFAQYYQCQDCKAYCFGKYTREGMVVR